MSGKSIVILAIVLITALVGLLCLNNWLLNTMYYWLADYILIGGIIVLLIVLWVVVSKVSDDIAKQISERKRRL